MISLSIIKNFATSFSVLIFLIFLETSNCSDNCSACKFDDHHKSTTQESIDKLKPICGKRFFTKGPDSSIFSFTVGICSSAVVSQVVPGFEDVGVVQKDTSLPKMYKLGSIKKADLKTGNNWMMLEYSGGEPYNNACNKAERKSTILIICDPEEEYGRLEYLEEDNSNKQNDCYYLFQLSHKAVCSERPIVVASSDGWSVGSMFCVVVISTAACYFLLGALFMRFVKGARGLEQIPNFAFWRELGHLQADGCNLVCRCADRHVNNYSGDIRTAHSESHLIYEDEP